MYDMLTGIRNAVSRCVAKPYRPLEKADFRARHKITFDILGNELTPSSKYEFKFKDYAPWVFRYIREHFNIEAADYLVLHMIILRAYLRFLLHQNTYCQNLVLPVKVARSFISRKTIDSLLRLYIIQNTSFYSAFSIIIMRYALCSDCNL